MALLALAGVPLVAVVVQDGAALVRLAAPVSEQHRPAVSPLPGVLEEGSFEQRTTDYTAYLLLLQSQPNIILVFRVGQENTHILLYNKYGRVEC